jgi:hypothetical protein
MRQRIVVLALALAGCDGVFNLDEIKLPADGGDTPIPDGMRLDANPLDNGLTLYIPFEGDFVDSVSKAPATCAGGSSNCPQFVPGVHGLAAAYDGGADCLTVDPSIVGTLFTVSLWFQVSTDTSVSLIAKPYMSTTLDSWQIDTDTGHTLRFISFNGSTPTSITAPASFTESTWTHVAITYDNAVRQIFVSGILRTSGGPSPFAITMDKVFIGCDRDSGSTSRRMAGLVDDVRVYSRVLTAAEIGALANM